MSELMFVVKSLVMSSVLVAVMQIRIGGSSIESQLEKSLKTSETAHWFQSAAVGGARVIKNLYRSVEDEFDHRSASR